MVWRNPGSAPRWDTPQGTHWDTLSLFPAVSPGECLITGQSHFKSFDDRHFTFSGVCQYLLAQDCQDHSFSVVIETVQVSPPGSPGMPTGMRAKETPRVLLSSGPPSKGEDRQGARGAP